MMCFFDKLKITFEGTDSYQPIEWIKNRIANANDFNGIQIKRQFTPADKKFVLKVTLDLETSPKRFTLSPQLAGILGI
jgi:chromatin remodeling complex protein RSC6